MINIDSIAGAIASLAFAVSAASVHWQDTANPAVQAPPGAAAKQAQVTSKQPSPQQCLAPSR